MLAEGGDGQRGRALGMTFSNFNSGRAAAKAMGFAGLAAVSAGLAKIGSHIWLSAAGTDSICGPLSLSDLVLWHLDSGAHCWGCPVLLLGLALSLGSATLALGTETPGGPAANLTPAR